MHRSTVPFLPTALLVTLAPMVATAQPDAPPAGAVNEPPLLTLEQAYDLARRNNRDLEAARARLEQSAEVLAQAWGTLYPTLTAQGKYQHNNKEITFVAPGMDGMPPRPIPLQKAEQLDAAGNISVPIFTPAAYAGLKAVQQNDKAAQANFAATEALILQTTAQAYFGLSGAEEVLLARRSAIEVAKSTEAIAATRLQAGTATKVDVSRAEFSRLRAEQAERESVAATAQARRALVTLLQINHPFRVSPPPDSSQAPAPPNVNLLVSEALKLRPEIAVLDRTIESLTDQARAQAWRWAPALSGFGNARAFNYVNFAGDHYSWAVGAQLDWVIYDGGTRDALRRQALAARRENQFRLDLLRSNVSDEVANARDQVELKRSAETTAARSVQLAKETLELVRAQYEAGTATQLDLLAAQDSLVLAQVALAQAHVDAAISDVALQRVSGHTPGR